MSICAAIIIGAATFAPMKHTRVHLACDHAQVVERVAHQHKIPAELVLAIIWRESKWCPTCVNNTVGATGVMQVVPKWAKNKRLTHVTTNIKEGVRILLRWRRRAHARCRWERRQGKRCNVWRRTLAGYSSGVSGLRDRNRGGRDYARTVSHLARRYKSKL